MLFSIQEVRRFASGLDHPEGVAVGRDGTVYAGGEGGQVYRISPDGRRKELIANTGGFCLGVTLDQQENIYICDSGKSAIFRINQNGKLDIFAEAANGRRFIQPNFSAFDSKGNLYFSDSGEWKKINGVIYRASLDGKVSVFNEGPFHFANGLALDSNERFLYVVESNLDRVLRIKILPDGSSGLPETYAEGLASVPDGLAFDSAGNLYVTTYGSSAVYRVTPEHRVDMVCRDIENEMLCLVTNCAFGGPHFDQLILANLGGQHLSMLDLGITGQRLWNQRAA